ncbi:MAG: cytochrome c biogenesis protein ResB [Deltaproteobacteria bacterium]|nr:cytochrome c biogenesis protein ResB [Deltaproteobacteria bacterium]
MTTKKSALWSFFSSVQLAVVLLSLIAFFAVIGTLVPQREAAVELAGRLSPGMFSFLDKMQIFDLYHSIWFFLLMILLAVNLIVCSLDRFPMAWRRFRLRPVTSDENVYKNLPEENNFQTTLESFRVKAVVADLLKKRFRRFESDDERGSSFFYAEKGRFSLFGVYIVHLSILVLIAGALIGFFSGLEGYVNIIEGRTVNALNLRNGNETLNLPFDVRCDKFSIEFYENGAPKSYQSDLTFLRNNQVISSGKLRVNHPLELEGFRFYQASYGASPEIKATLTVLKNGKKTMDKTIGLGEIFNLPGGEAVQVIRVEENLMRMGPAVKLVVRGAQEEAAFWVFQQIDKIREMNPGMVEQVPMFNPGSFRPYLFVLTGVEEKYYTGLQITRDPGTPVVFAAAVLLICGLMLVLFSYFRQIWIRIDEEKDRSKITIAGRSYKNREGLEREVRYLLAELKNNLEHSK